MDVAELLAVKEHCSSESWKFVRRKKCIGRYNPIE